ncbi:MAG: TIGR02147 family protein [Chitinispirillaceae bacterium]|nr:TIGR02147 family protein [Chitinispirillaceae bacterium]
MQRIEFYDDFRVYLREFYEDQKRRFPHFSYRYFCGKAGLKSPSHFIEIMDGKRKLTSKMLDSFLKGLGLTESDARYFTVLVHFNQSRNSTEKQQLLLQMRGMKRKVKQALVSTDYFEYYSKWYNIVIRELACLIDWNDDYSVLAKSVIPPIRKIEARESVEFLLQAGFLKKENGSYTQTEPAITSGSEVCSLGIRSYNRFMAERAHKAIDEFPPTERDIQTLTVGISRDSFSLIKQEMQEFFSRVVRIVDDDKSAERVYNVNVHLFPLSIKPADGVQGDE